MPTLVMVYSLSTGWSILKQFNIKHVLGGKYLYYYQHYLDLRRKDKLGRFKNKMHDEHSVFQTWKTIFHFPKLLRGGEEVRSYYTSSRLFCAVTY